MTTRKITPKQRLLLAVACGFVIGLAWLVTVRYITYDSPHTHYHANFALYVNGQRDEFKSFTFYEEVQTCSSDEINNPRTRTHLHDQINYVAHVHDPAATWGHLFANLGYTLGDDVLSTDAGTFDDPSLLTFTLNGKQVEHIANQTIHSEDVLLINYGSDSEEVLWERYAAIIKDAGEYNQRTDPSACSGSKSASWQERLKAAFGLD